MEQVTETTIPKTGSIPNNQETEKTNTRAGAERFGFTGPRIYLGPNAPKKGLRFGMGFKDGLTKDILEKCEACPSLFALIVPPSEVMECRRKLTEKGSAKHQALIAVEKYLKGGE